jgi:hypothetical protein
VYVGAAFVHTISLFVYSLICVGVGVDNLIEAYGVMISIVSERINELTYWISVPRYGVHEAYSFLYGAEAGKCKYAAIYLIYIYMQHDGIISSMHPLNLVLGFHDKFFTRKSTCM